MEVYRKSLKSTGVVQDERETVHLSDDHRRVCMAETKTITGASPVGSPTTYLRFQLDNHLGTCSVEVTEDGSVISYEEYHPYGTSAYRAQSNSVDVSSKRYRYTGKERDDETGLYYHGARYYAPWLGRWTAADPLALADGSGGYTYARNEPTNLSDPNGRQVSGNAEQLAQYPQLARVLSEATETTLPINPFPYTILPDATPQELGLDAANLPGTQVDGWEGVDRSPFTVGSNSPKKAGTPRASSPSLFKLGLNFAATEVALPFTVLMAALSPDSPSVDEAADAFRPLPYTASERAAGLEGEMYLGLASAAFGAVGGLAGGGRALGRAVGLIDDVASPWLRRAAAEGGADVGELLAFRSRGPLRARSIPGPPTSGQVRVGGRDNEYGFFMLEGHGSQAKGGFVTSATIEVPRVSALSEEAGEAIAQRGTIPAKLFQENPHGVEELVRSRIYRPGQVVPNLILEPPVGINYRVGSTTVTRPTLLKDVVEEIRLTYPGENITCVWAACRTGAGGSL